MAKTVTIDGKKYQLDDLSDAAQKTLVSLRVADAKLKELQAEVALVRTARQAYAKALAASLPTEAK